MFTIPLKTFKLHLNWNTTSHAIVLTSYVVICDKYKEEYIGKTGEGKTKLRDRVRV